MQQSFSKLRKNLKREAPELLYFGGVAFKGQAGVLDSALSGVTKKAAAGLMEVVTTSGPATGIAADLQKIKTMAQAAMSAGNPSLGIASGVDHKNIGSYIQSGARFFFCRNKY